MITLSILITADGLQLLLITVVTQYAKEAIKADREHLLNHIRLNVDGVIQNKDYIVDTSNHYSETYIRIDKNSIINTLIELL